MISKNILNEFTRFAMVGAVGTLAQYSVLITLVETRLSGPLIASTLGFTLGAVINYSLNHKFTFQSTKKHSDAFWKFMFIATCGAALNYILLYIGIHYLYFQYLIAQVCATGIVLLWNYTGNKLWSFA